MNCCSNCRYFFEQDVPEVRSTLSNYETTIRYGYTATVCRRFPKHEDRNYADWCGEFKEKEPDNA